MAEKLFRAITEVHITTEAGKPGDKSKGIRPTPPQVAIIPANARFEMDHESDDAKYLMANKAIELVKDDDEEVRRPMKVNTKNAPKKTAAKTAAKTPAKTAAKDEGTGGEGEDNDGSNLV